jgi:AcrR family transcriptional regulator
MTSGRSPVSTSISASHSTAEATPHATQRQLLLDAAERLFAARGVDAVSLRAVMAEAGTNVASVHYHFGSKPALVSALVAARSDVVARRRTALLDRLEARSDASVRDLADAFVRPVAEMALGGHVEWVRLVDGIIAGGHPALAQITESFGRQGARMTALLERLHPDVTPATIRFRLAQALPLTFRVLGDLDAARRTLALAGVDLGPEDTVRELTDVVTAILAGPPATAGPAATDHASGGPGVLRDQPALAPAPPRRPADW